MAWIQSYLTQEDGSPILTAQGSYIEVVTPFAAPADTPASLGQNDGTGILQENGDEILLAGSGGVAPQTGPFNSSATYPPALARATRGGPGYRTIIQQLDDGDEIRNSFWQRPQRRWSAGHNAENPADAAALRKLLISFFRSRSGSTEGFRLRDPLDWSTHPTGMMLPDPTNWEHREVIGAGRFGVLTYQLVKRYKAGFWERARPITHPTRPEIGDRVFAIYVDGVAQTEVTDYSVDFSSGKVTFTSQPTLGAQIEWSGTFDTPVRFGVDAYPIRAISSIAHQVGEIPMVEERWNVEHGEPRGMIGAAVKSSAVDLQLSLGDGFFQFVSMTTSSRSVYLPTSTNLVEGDNVLCVANAGANAFAIKDHNEATVVTSLAAGSHAFLGLTS